MTRYLLCTDLDRTLIANGAQPVSPAAGERFAQLAGRADVTLVYVSGRHLALIEQAIAEHNLPQAGYAIADVGSTIYQLGASGWQQWQEWDEHIAPDWCNLTHDELYSLLSVFPALTLQESEKQNRYKLSFYVPPDTDARALINEMDILLLQAGISANLVWSIDEAAATGLLDVLPARAGKLHALRFLMQKLDIALDSTLFAGDSGNDMDVLLSDIPAVLVANAAAEVKQQAAKAAGDVLYIAQGGYLGMNGNYAGGILEGVAHYWPEMDAWLRTRE